MKKILLVNNLQNFLERNKCLLDREGFKIFTATSAVEALQILSAQKVDLIVSVLDMPEMGGDTLCSLIRQRGELSSVSILLVCYPGHGEVERASSCGANAWLLKPVRPNLLLKEVGKLLNVPTRGDHRAIVHGTVQSREFSGISCDISVSGILCKTDMPLSPDEMITNMSFIINSHEIITDGKVVRSMSMPDGMYNHVVKFIGLAPEHSEEIEKYVATNLTLMALPAGKSPFFPLSHKRTPGL
jgi:CheY-like chemotaxis protein